LELRNIQFRTTVLENNSRHHGVYLEPKDKMAVLNNFLITYRSSNSVQILITELEAALQYEKPNTREITIDESHIYANNSIARFDMQLVTQLEPVEIEIYSAIEFFRLYKEYLKKYENKKIPGLLPETELKDTEWDYISGWENNGLKPKHIIKWAYADNGYFKEQDEDLLMYKPELISTMHELMIDPNSKRRLDLYKLLSAYAIETFKKGKNHEAKTEFLKILKISSNDMNHLSLLNQIEQLKKKPDDNT